jgi:hypothetical protein
MKLVLRKDIDESKWERWCTEATESQPFLSLKYLDALAENLVFAINEDETGGIPLPFFERLGVKTLYMPVFCRWIDWVGANRPSDKELTHFILQEFKQGDIYFRKEILTIESEELIYQTLTKDQFQLNSQAKRKVKAIEKLGYSVSEKQDHELSLALIREELIDKFATLKENNFDSLEVLVRNLQDLNILQSVNLVKNGRIFGSLFLVQTKNRLLYLKGACVEEAKQKGGMYYLMDAAIQLAEREKLSFDFGGSRIDGVRKFNQCFGGIDSRYYRYTWDKGPIWYKTLKGLKNKWKKK